MESRAEGLFHIMRQQAMACSGSCAKACDGMSSRQDVSGGGQKQF